MTSGSKYLLGAAGSSLGLSAGKAKQQEIGVFTDDASSSHRQSVSRTVAERLRSPRARKQRLTQSLTPKEVDLETQVLTPQLVFMQPQRLVVPLFQRRYVWNQESQWEPLWDDVVRVAERLLQRSHFKPQPHFLGAVVLQQIQNPVGLMQTRTIIDGQQRLTTLQLLLDALHAELLSVGASAPAARIEPLVRNAEPFCSHPEDRFKVWPTNRDRAAFNAVMAAGPPVDHDAIGYRGERMLEAHRFFSEQARDWLKLQGDSEAQKRAAA